MSPTTPLIETVRAADRRRRALAKADDELVKIGRLIADNGLGLATVERATGLPRTTLRRAARRAGTENTPTTR